MNRSFKVDSIKRIAAAENIRIIEKQTSDGWVQCRMRELQKGDVFRMFEEEDVPVNGTWKVTTPALKENGVDAVVADPC